MSPPSQSKLHLNSRFWPAAIGILFLLQVFFPFRGWLVLFIGMGSAFLISWIWARGIRKQLSLQREIRFGWAQVGDILEERFRLTNLSVFPGLWVEIVDHSTIPGGSLSRATGVGGQTYNEWVAHKTCSQRGVYTLGPTTIRTGDPFGIFTVEIQDSAQANIIVTPPVLHLPTIQVASGGRSGDGRPSRQSIDQSVSTSGVRSYHSGDSLRWVHWPTTARRESFFVRTFDHTPSSDWWILLDLDRNVQAGAGSRSTEEAGVILAASLAARGLKSGVAVGLVASSAELVWIPPRTGEGQRWEILQALARVSTGNLPLADVLKSSEQTFRSQTSLVIITSSLEESWIQELSVLLWRGVVPTILFVDPGSFGDAPSSVPLKEILEDLDVAHYFITPEILEPGIEDQSKDRNAWDWRVLPTGKAVPVRKPKDFTWKSLA